jgi:hypothetical protein
MSQSSLSVRRRYSIAREPKLCIAHVLSPQEPFRAAQFPRYYSTKKFCTPPDNIGISFRTARKAECAFISFVDWTVQVCGSISLL